MKTERDEQGYNQTETLNSFMNIHQYPGSSQKVQGRWIIIFFQDLLRILQDPCVWDMGQLAFFSFSLHKHSAPAS